MEDTMLELIEVCRQKEFYCMHNDVDDLIKSALNSKLLSINLESQRLDKKKQDVKNIVEQPTKCGTRIVKSLQNFRVKKSSIPLNNTSQISPVHAITPILPIKEPEYSLSMGYEHLSTIPETESDEVIESSAKNLLPILSEYEEFSGAFMPTSVADEERIWREHEEYISLMEKFFSINPCPRPLENFHSNTIIETLPTSPISLEDSDSQREEIDIFTGTDELLPPNDLSFPRPLPEPPDVEFFFDFEPNSRELIVAVMNNIEELNEDECFNLGDKIDIFRNVEDDDYFSFIYVIQIFLPYLIYHEVSPLLLSARSEETIFDPGISV
nr:hypothetical protein [Tanacetum cinerariifolium]